MPEESRARSETGHARTWVTTPERGSPILLHFMRFLSLRCGRRASRIVLSLIAVYFFLAAPTASRASRSYLRRVLVRPPTSGDRFKHILSFATVIHDRVYLLNDRTDLFSIELRGDALLLRAQSDAKGCFLIGAHLGSFELAGAFGRKDRGVSIVMAMYAENAQKIGAALAVINPQVKMQFIRLGSVDAMLQVRARLDEGAFVGVLGDRARGNEDVLQFNFLGAAAPFPVGPWRAAAVLRRRVFFIAGLYCGSNRYRIVVDDVADFTSVPASDREAAIHAAIGRYVSLLERYCREQPYNWFNFYDFWNETAQ